MIHILDAYSIVNKSVLQVCRDTNTLTLYVEEKPAPPRHRLVEDTYVITDSDKKRLTGVITAHNLEQYTNRFYGINLKERVDVWLDILINVNKRDLLYEK